MKERLINIIPKDLPERASAFGYNLVAALVIFAAFIVLSMVTGMIIQRVCKRTDPQRASVIKLIGDVIKVIIIISGVITAMGSMDINVSALVAGLGLTGFALGFAFKDALSNILAGIMVLLYHPFRQGDSVEVIGLPLQGKVVGIDLRYTTLQAEGKIFLVPNSVLLTNAISLKK